MLAPQRFVDQLNSEFDGRLRIRWSEKEREWRLEQKVGNAVTAPIAFDSGRDDLICACDGYAYVLSVKQGDRMCCPKCEWRELRVPVREFAHVGCQCGYKGIVGFFHLDDNLITHLRMIDPTRGRSKDLVRALDYRNERRLELAEEAAIGNGNAKANEDYNQLVGIPQFGYSHAKHWPSDMGSGKAA